MVPIEDDNFVSEIQDLIENNFKKLQFIDKVGAREQASMEKYWRIKYLLT